MSISGLLQLLPKLSDIKPTNNSLVIPWDLYSLLWSAIIWALIHYLSTKIFQRFAEKFLPYSKQISRKKIEITRLKFKVAGFKFVSYGIMSLLGISILSNEGWVFNQKQYFSGWPLHPISTATKLYYNAGFGMYLFGCFSVFFEAEQSRLDLIVMLIHHFATLLLIGSSYLYSFHRIGYRFLLSSRCVILLLHDLSDPFMEVGKLMLYTGNNFYADIAFGIFAIGKRVIYNF